MTAALRGLYAITPESSASTSTLAEQVVLAIRGGVRLVQYRDKGSSDALKRERGQVLLEICRSAGIPLIINDDLDLTLRLQADGVHLGRDDPDPHEARMQLGSEAIVGVSCYNDFALAEIAEQAGANYIAFGAFFPSTTKPLAVRADPALLAEARQRLQVPAVAIGGITPQNGGLLITAGAQMLAVVTGIFTQPDITAAARAYSNLFPTETSR
jgi:thiamine-phosphate pyrophosphorylase